MSNRRVDPFVPPSPLDETEPEIQELIERGQSLGFLTYQELNTDAPEEAPCPAMMDRILQSLDIAAIKVIDGDARELQAPARGRGGPRRQGASRRAGRRPSRARSTCRSRPRRSTIRSACTSRRWVRSPC